MVVSGLILVLLIGIGIVIVRGDQAGVGLSLIDPRTGANVADTSAGLTIPATAAIRLHFSEAMDGNSVHIHFSPDIPITATWSDTTFSLVPQTAFAPGQSYSLTLDDGARSIHGRPVHGTLTWRIAIEPLRIVYISPAQPTATNRIPNLWLVMPGSQPVQITHSIYGVVDFAVSPDGTRIAFSQPDSTGKTDLFLLNIADNAVRQITRCVDAPCRAPDWSPDGRRFVYERADSTNPDSDVRAWLLDLSTLQTAPLFSESQWLGKAPHWSPDGTMITLYDRSAGGIFLVNVTSGERSELPTLEDYSGVFAPGKSTLLAFDQLAMTPEGAIRQLIVANYTTHTIQQLRPSDGSLADDPAAAWNPDGVHLAVMRRYMDARTTPASQVYELDARTGDAVPLVVDPQYAHGALSWSPDGAQLLMQRYPLNVPNGQTGIWTYDLQDKQLSQVADNGFFPQWLP